EWHKTERNATLVIREEPNLVALGAAVRAINDNNPALLEIADEVAALSVQSGASVRQNAIAGQLVMLTQRMAKNANAMLAGDVVDPEVAFLLGKDSNTFRDLLQGLLQGNEALRMARVSLIALALLFLIGKAWISDSRRRAEQSEQQNRANQDAIMRLLDDIGNLASGDLTVRAKVTEHITGAIADSINYTIDELRR